ncbi:MAG: iron-sulfur cluster assembly accessory protein [Cyclobacteriaceae bacterium]|nr:iron-sulfur cluster assembly accessory protein [Cyclobacteriaceae bacterium]
MIMDIPVQITAKALDHIKAIMKKKSIPSYYGLRLGTNNTASCGSTSFIIGFDTKKTGDDVFVLEEIEVLINKKELLHLINVTLDYEDGIDVSGFKFEKN